MQCKIASGFSSWAKSGNKFLSLKELVNLCCPSHFRYNFDSCYEALIREFRSLLKQLLILLVVTIINLRQLPGKNKLVTLSFVGPSVPLLGALMKNTYYLVDKLNTFLLKDVCNLDEVLHFADTEYHLSPMTGYHDLKRPIST